VERVEGLVARLYEATRARCRDLGLGEEPSQQLLVESILRANARLGRLNQELGEANRALGEAQQQLAESRAMVRLGEMTAGAAHELNNPLTVISGRAQALISRLRDEHDRATAQTIVDATGRLSDLISRLHRIANPPRPDFRPCELGAVMEEVIRRAKQRCAGRAGPSGVLGVKLTLAEGLDTARLDPGLMTDAVVEIVVNAIEASPRSPVEVRVLEDPAEPSRLLFQVIDDGSGMSEHALDHAVDPFFSEKPAGRQAGLGLALAHRLVALHGGEIVLASKVGRGTSVTVALPEYRWSREGSTNQVLRDVAPVIATGSGVQRAA
jgi:signal transduction histidine kinase